MASATPSTGDVLSRLAGLLGLGKVESRLSAVLGSLQRQTRAQLVEWSRRLGLAGSDDLTRDALLSRLQQTLERLGVGGQATGGVRAETSRADAPVPADRTHRFDLGRPAEGDVAPEHIPWSYGQDRVTAMVVDPDRLFVYWEVTDDGIARARTGLGPGGPDAWLNLRIYDVTGRLFDGTNAHGYTDHKVERTDRQWFFDLRRPESTAVVEIGLKSFEGYFVRIARSGRIDFPRKEPAPPGAVEWLTVRAASRELTSPVPAPGPPAAAAPAFTPPPALDEAAGLQQQVIAGEPERTFHTEWHDGERTIAWRGPDVRTTWEAGPFPLPPEVVEERHDGATHVQVQNGRTRVVYGPWQVVIRGLGARAERQVVATWEVQRTWATTGGVGRVEAAGLPVGPGGAEQRVGASERHWIGASELRLGGASEVWRLGATEIRFLGASERAYGGASEQRGARDDAAPLPYPDSARPERKS